MTDGLSRRRRIVARAATTYRRVVARQRELERRAERRFPRLYDARHALGGFGRVLWPLVAPLLAGLIVLPFAALYLLGSLLDLQAPSIDLPSIDLPDVPLPSVTAPGWLRAIGDVIGACFSVLTAIAPYAVAVLAVILGVHQTRDARRRRIAAEQLGRPELLRRLAVTLRALEGRADARRATTLGGLCDDEPRPE